MKNLLKKIVFGNDPTTNGLFALAIIALIALGCTCNKNFDLANIGKKTPEPTETETPSTPTPTTTSTSTPKKEIVKADASKGEMPSDEELQEMVKETLMTFNDAVQSGDFTEFHANVCKPWQRQKTPEGFKETFGSKINIDNIKPYEAQFTKTPEIGRTSGYKALMLEGKYPTSPNVTKFVLNYIPEGKEWKLSRIEVDNTSRF